MRLHVDPAVDEGQQDGGQHEDRHEDAGREDPEAVELALQVLGFEPRTRGFVGGVGFRLDQVGLDQG